jgi:GNAT superfamily N-acetyltransferase
VAPLPVTVTTLELTARPQRPHALPPLARLMLLRAEAFRTEKPPLSFYRYLYDAIGARCFWVERRLWSDETLRHYLADPLIELSLLYCDGVPAGMAELDLRDLADGRRARLSLFGLLTEFQGRGFGRFLVDWTVDAAFRREPRVLEAVSRSLDHPRALPLLQRAGFVAVQQASASIDDPRESGLIPKDTPLPGAPQTPADHPPAEAGASENVTRLRPT